MAIRIIKNYTTQDCIIHDLGDVVIPKNGAVDLGGDETRLIQLACSTYLLTALSQGVANFQVNDGSVDYAFDAGIDLIRRIDQTTQTDTNGRWLIRTESRRTQYDAVFAGSGDDMVNYIIGGGTPFKWDFSTQDDLVPAPTGFLRKQINWNFMDMIYPKEGKISFTNAPLGSYVNMFLLCPPGLPYPVKTPNANGDVVRSYRIALRPTVFQGWICNYWMEGTVAYDTLTTEGSTDYPGMGYLIWRTEITVPDIPAAVQFHGHWIFQIYRPRSVYIV
jgi:hypothetical protein